MSLPLPRSASFALALVFVAGCAGRQECAGVGAPEPEEPEAVALAAVGSASDSPKPEVPVTAPINECVGTPSPPPSVAAKLAPADDPTLLDAALGAPSEGKLCQGQVYTVTEAFTIYRAWNSTNPGSELGHWWAFDEPAGTVAGYREDYEICYQWSPLDKLTHCEVEVGTTLVVGNGQSATCSEYLSYAASATLQIYLDDAGQATSGCAALSAVFSWE